MFGEGPRITTILNYDGGDEAKLKLNVEGAREKEMRGYQKLHTSATEAKNHAKPRCKWDSVTAEVQVGMAYNEAETSTDTTEREQQHLDRDSGGGSKMSVAETLTWHELGQWRRDHPSAEPMENSLEEEEGDGSGMWARTSSSKGIWDKADAAKRVAVAVAVIVVESRDDVAAIVVDSRDEVVDVARRVVLVVAGSVADSRDKIVDVVANVDVEGLVFVVVVAVVVVDVETLIIAVINVGRRVALVVAGSVADSRDEIVDVVASDDVEALVFVVDVAVVVADVEALVFAVAAEEVVVPVDGVAVVVFVGVVVSIGVDLEDELVEDNSLDDAFGFLRRGMLCMSSVWEGRSVKDFFVHNVGCVVKRGGQSNAYMGRVTHSGCSDIKLAMCKCGLVKINASMFDRLALGLVDSDREGRANGELASLPRERGCDVGDREQDAREEDRPNGWQDATVKKFVICDRVDNQPCSRITTAMRISCASADCLGMSKVEVAAGVRGALNREWKVRSPSNRVVAMPLEATASATWSWRRMCASIVLKQKILPVPVGASTKTQSSSLFSTARMTRWKTACWEGRNCGRLESRVCRSSALGYGISSSMIRGMPWRDGLSARRPPVFASRKKEHIMKRVESSVCFGDWDNSATTFADCDFLIGRLIVHKKTQLFKTFRFVVTAFVLIDRTCVRVNHDVSVMYHLVWHFRNSDEIMDPTVACMEKSVELSEKAFDRTNRCEGGFGGKVKTAETEKCSTVFVLQIVDVDLCECGLMVSVWEKGP
ncbi:hypothetical protein CBR_g55631 [Chara braunii]|uniref:Uncharacterized protein n=1 Tax=Chara braunii TaxID=69332 RepID=A0A388MD40_CHABU|nr:hypothetical protein CBR_g55631 [Chara braunii]|eukprot:GBG92480.1 hypothetical protein CBR_g55631 [Chara braunii]